MKFYAEPNLTVRVTPRSTRPKNLRVIIFNDKGEYETEHPIVIALLKQHFKFEEPTEPPKIYKCKLCDFTAPDPLALGRHVKSHKKENKA